MAYHACVCCYVYVLTLQRCENILFWMNSQSLMGKVALEGISVFIEICAMCLDVLVFKCDLHSPSVSFFQEMALYRQGF